MGTKRVGLARVEALMENLKRELALGGSRLNGLQREVISQNTSFGGGGPHALTVSQSGSLILLDKDEGTALQLPAITAADIGTTYTFVETLASNNLRSVVTQYDDDCIIGGFAMPFDAALAADGGHVGHKAIVVGDAIVRLQFDDNATEGGGAVGACITVTAIAAGNTGAGGGDKAVWVVEGQMVAQHEGATGAGFVATS